MTTEQKIVVSYWEKSLEGHLIRFQEYGRALYINQLEGEPTATAALIALRALEHEIAEGMHEVRKHPIRITVRLVKNRERSMHFEFRNLDGTYWIGQNVNTYGRKDAQRNWRNSAGDVMKEADMQAALSEQVERENIEAKERAEREQQEAAAKLAADRRALLVHLDGREPSDPYCLLERLIESANQQTLDRLLRPLIVEGKELTHWAAESSPWGVQFSDGEEA